MFDRIGLRVKDIEKAGAEANGKPGLRTDYAPNRYGAFLLDGEGNNVEAVCYR